jgi:hypothetical protein
MLQPEQDRAEHDERRVRSVCSTFHPMMRDILTGLLIYQLSSQITGPMGRTLQLQALRLIEQVTEVRATKLEQLE